MFTGTTKIILVLWAKLIIFSTIQQNFDLKSIHKNKSSIKTNLTKWFFYVTIFSCRVSIKKICFNGVVIKSFLMFFQPMHLNMLYKIITDSIGS